MSRCKRCVILITGASSGIGRACANYLHQRGHRVYGTTEITVHRHRAQAAQQGSAYGERYTRAVSVMVADEMSAPSPTIVAHLLERIIASPSLVDGLELLCHYTLRVL